MIRYVLSVALAAGFALAQPVAAAHAGDGWASLANAISRGGRRADGAGLVGIERPARAEDAAIVPVTMRVTLPAGDARQLKVLTLVIDENPPPGAPTFPR